MHSRMANLASGMSLSELAERCRSEMIHYSLKEAFDDLYCLEIFRRAMRLGDSLAWEFLHRVFNSTMLRWLRQHPTRDAASQLDSEENYIVQDFERFWRATAHNQQNALLRG